MWETGPERSRILIDIARECSRAWEFFFYEKSGRERKKKTVVFIERKHVILTSGYKTSIATEVFRKL